MLSLAGPEPSQPVPRADEEPFPQTFQPSMHVGWDEVAWISGFHPLEIYLPVSPRSSIRMT